MTVSGSSNRTANATFRQFPQRDEDAVSNHDQAAPVTIEGMDKPGWSNSATVKNAPVDQIPDSEPVQAPKPGFSNTSAKPVSEQTSPVTQPDTQATKKTTARKSAKKG